MLNEFQKIILVTVLLTSLFALPIKAEAPCGLTGLPLVVAELASIPVAVFLPTFLGFYLKQWFNCRNSCNAGIAFGWLLTAVGLPIAYVGEQVPYQIVADLLKGIGGTSALLGITFNFMAS